MTDLITFLKARLDEDARVRARLSPCHDILEIAKVRLLAEVAAKRAIIDEHAPEWRNVEWPHDQDGTGKAQVCRRCQNAEHTYWDPPVGEAGVLPEGFVTPYVLAPCTTLRLLALPFASHPDYQESWRP